MAIRCAPTDHGPVEPGVGYRFDLSGYDVAGIAALSCDIDGVWEGWTSKPPTAPCRYLTGCPPIRNL